LGGKFEFRKGDRGCEMNEDAGFDNEPFEWSDVEFESDTWNL
jgi:hypothetical protein